MWLFGLRQLLAPNLARCPRRKRGRRYFCVSPKSHGFDAGNRCATHSLRGLFCAPAFLFSRLPSGVKWRRTQPSEILSVFRVASETVVPSGSTARVAARLGPAGTAGSPSMGTGGLAVAADRSGWQFPNSGQMVDCTAQPLPEAPRGTRPRDAYSASLMESSGPRSEGAPETGETLVGTGGATMSRDAKERTEWRMNLERQGGSRVGQTPSALCEQCSPRHPPS